MNVDINIQSEDKRLRPENSEVERLWADNSKARATLSWQPQYQGLEGFKKGLAETIEWFLNPGNLNNYKFDIYNL
jgi:dTDP-glucose 4,6-dehydratase